MATLLRRALAANRRRVVLGQRRAVGLGHIPLRPLGLERPGCDSDNCCLAAAHAGKSLLQVNVYDGSDNGQKVYQSLTVIGRTIAPNERKPTDAAGSQSALADLDRWPVTISYFEKTEQTGEQTPVYSISFELYDNGISRALVLDYGDFAVSGEMTSLELKKTKPCP